MLSESYEGLFRADAILSERRIADLLAPLSFNLFNSVGGEATLNDYQALFDINENRTGIGFEGYTNEDLYAGNIFHAGKTDKFGYFLEYSGGHGGGSKEGRYRRDNRVRLAGQYQPTFQHRFILEGGYTYITGKEPNIFSIYFNH